MTNRATFLGIGQVARQAGVTVEALRYYERIGLLAPPLRSSGGMRRFRPDVLVHLRFIKQAQALGLSLGEIQQLTQGADPRSRTACWRVHNVLDQHIAEIDKRLEALRALRETLVLHRSACEDALVCDADQACPTLSALGRMRG